MTKNENCDVPENYLQWKTQFDRIRQKMKETAKPFFEQYSKQLFKDFPELESFSWAQYTPYNDGDVTSLGVFTKYTDIEISGEGKPPEPLKKAIIDDFLKKFEEDDLVQMFGEEIKITVTKDGITVGGYCEC